MCSPRSQEDEATDALKNNESATVDISLPQTAFVNSVLRPMWAERIFEERDAQRIARELRGSNKYLVISPDEEFPWLFIRPKKKRVGRQAGRKMLLKI